MIFYPFSITTVSGVKIKWTLESNLSAFVNLFILNSKQIIF